MDHHDARNGWLTPADDIPPALPDDHKTAIKRLLWAALQGGLIFLAFQVYKTVRKFGIRDDPSMAFDHARNVIHFEDRLGLFFELDCRAGHWAVG